MNNDTITYRGEWRYDVVKRFVFNTKLSKDARFLWIVLRGYVSEQSPLPFPSVRTLCVILGVTKDTLAGYGRELVDAGYLEKRQRSGQGGKFASNEYTLVDPGSPSPNYPVTENPSPDNQATKTVPVQRPTSTKKKSPAGKAAGKGKGRKIDGAEKGKAHAEFIEQWVTDYERFFGRAYKFTGGKDGSAVKRLLATGMTPAELMNLAALAWASKSKFNCKQAVTIAGFDARFNEIREEVGHKGAEAKPDGKKHGPEDWS